MSIHTILSQEIASDKTNRIYVRSKKYPNGGLIMGEEVDKFLKHLATRIVEEVGKELIDEIPRDRHTTDHATGETIETSVGYNNALEETRFMLDTKLQKMKGDL